MLTYQRIKDLCREKGVTVAQCERDCGLSKGSLCKIETSNPNMRRLQALADYFGLTTDVLINGESEEGYYFNKETADLAQEIYQDKEMHMLFDAVRGSTPQEMRDFRDMILLMKRREKGE